MAEFLGRRALQFVESAGDTEAARELKDRFEGAVEHLPERAVRRLNEISWALHFLRPQWTDAGLSLAGLPATLHATGTIFPDPQSTAPLAPQAIAAWLAAACSYQSTANAARTDLRRAALRLWHQHASACIDEATAVHEVVRIAHAGSRQLLVERQDSDARLDRLPLPEFFRSRGFEVSEVGDTGATDAEDYQRILHAHPDGAVMVITDRGDPLERLRRLRRSVPGAFPLVAWARQSWPAEPDLPNHSAATIRELLRGGATAVVTPTGQLLGGPSGALAIGPLRWIEDLERVPRRMAPAAAAATAAVVDAWNQPEARRDIPLLRALRRDPRNARTRARQLALQLNGSPTIASAIAEDCATQLFADSASEPFSSTRLRIRHTVRPAARWARLLADRQPRLYVGVEEASITVDLKLIDPEHDARLAALLLDQNHDG